jgi:CRP-like cAMP-binding protein
MPQPNQAETRNRLLATLSADDFGLLQQDLEAVSLALRQVLEKPHEPVECVYFVEQGITSVVGMGNHRKRVEIGLVGYEGMTGVTVVLGSGSSPHETYMQVAGAGLCLRADGLRKAMQASESLRAILLRYAQAFMVQTAHTAIAGHAKLEERLARWLLMAHDRIDGDELPLVHEFLALMLGVRRPGVTVALQILEGRGLIRAERGCITVVDREGLEEAANGSYGIPEAEYRRLIA